METPESYSAPTAAAAAAAGAAPVTASTAPGMEEAMEAAKFIKQVLTLAQDPALVETRVAELSNVMQRALQNRMPASASGSASSAPAPPQSFVCIAETISDDGQKQETTVATAALEPGDIVCIGAVRRASPNLSVTASAYEVFVKSNRRPEKGGLATIDDSGGDTQAEQKGKEKADDTEPVPGLSVTDAVKSSRQILHGLTASWTVQKLDGSTATTGKPWFPAELMTALGGLSETGSKPDANSYQGLVLLEKVATSTEYTLSFFTSGILLVSHVLEYELHQACLKTRGRLRRTWQIKGAKLAHAVAACVDFFRKNYPLDFIRATELSNKSNGVACARWWKKAASRLGCFFSSDCVQAIKEIVHDFYVCVLVAEWVAVPVMADSPGSLAIKPADSDIKSVGFGLEDYPGVVNIGHCLYSGNVSQFEHSCAPNVARFFVGEYCICVALDFISAGETLTVNLADASREWTPELSHAAMYPTRCTVLSDLGILRGKSICKCHLCQLQNTYYWSGTKEAVAAQAKMEAALVAATENIKVGELKKHQQAQLALVNHKKVKTAVDEIKHFTVLNHEFFGIGTYHRLSGPSISAWVSYFKQNPAMASRPPKNLLEQHAIWSITLAALRATIPPTDHTVSVLLNLACTTAFQNFLPIKDMVERNYDAGQRNKQDLQSWFCSAALCGSGNLPNALASLQSEIVGMRMKFQLDQLSKVGDPMAERFKKLRFRRIDYVDKWRLLTSALTKRDYGLTAYVVAQAVSRSKLLYTAFGESLELLSGALTTGTS